MNKRIVAVVCIFAIIGAVLAFVILSSPPSSSSSTVLYVDPQTVEGIVVGQDFMVNIRISNITDLYGWEFKFGWNASVLDEVSVNEGPFLNSTGPTFFTYYLNTTNEHVVVDCNLLGSDTPGVNGSGVLATITFRVRENGACDLNLYDTILEDPNTLSISHVVHSGHFST